MLLLDHNLPQQLHPLLETLGLKGDTAGARGWSQLRNGDLVTAAHAAGFDTIVTRDRKFAAAAGQTLIKYPEIAIVVVLLPQRSWKHYKTSFEDSWNQRPFVPKPGQVVLWP